MSLSARRFAFLLLLLPGAGALLGCVEPAPPTVRLHAEHDGWADVVRPDFPSEGAFYDAPANTVHLRGALNEVLGFRLFVAADGLIDITPSAFTADDQAFQGNVSLYRIHDIHVDRWPGWHLKHVLPQDRRTQIGDVLVPASAPRGGLPAATRADAPLAVWVDVRIPRGTAPGDYRGWLDVAVDGAVLASVQIELTVWPFVLPDAGMPEAIADVDHQAVFRHHVERGGQPCMPPRILHDHPARDELTAALAATMRLLHDHRISGHLPRLYPIAKINAAGSIDVDWTDYDRVVSPYLNGAAYPDRVASRTWRFPFDETFPPPPAYGALQSPTYARLATTYLADAADHFATAGWLNRSYVRIPHADAMSPAAREATDHFGYLVHHADPRLRTLSRLFPQDAAADGWYAFDYHDLRDQVDVWAPPAQFFDRAAIASDRNSAALLTVGRPPFSGTADVRGLPADARVIPWQARAAGAIAAHLGTANPWPMDEDADGAPQACIDHDPAALIYPGTPFGLAEPIPSLRLKRLRRGMQDVAYMTLLAARGQDHIAATLTESLIAHWGSDAYGAHCADGRPHGWVQDVRIWDTARRIMADELLSDLRVSNPGDVPDTLRWQRFMDDTRDLRFEVMGVRVRRAGPRPEDGVEVECTVSIHNRRRTPVEGRLAFEQLPVGWSGMPAVRYVAAIPPGGTRQVVLAALVGGLTWDNDGVRYLKLVFEDAAGARRRLRARMAHVAAQPLREPITLDGDLSDWPTGAGNSAGDFVLIAGEGCDDLSGRSARPQHETLCFVGLRNERLHFGVRCELSDAGRRGLMQRRTAEADDLVPSGEDAVEILLDPTNSGSASSADVYRIVIGAGGAYAELGVTTEPPTCPRRPWAADIRHAVRVADDHWSAEVEVPLAAMPPAFRHTCVWAMNICRFSYEDQVYANWSGAVGNVYNPWSFGNLTVP